VTKRLTLPLALVAMTVFSSLGLAQETREGQTQPPANPCQSIIDEAGRQARARTIDVAKSQKELKDCATKNRIPITESEITKKSEQPRPGPQPAGTNLPGFVAPCLSTLPAGFMFWFVSGGSTFTQPQYAGNSWNVATVQLESTRSSVLYSFAPGYGSSTAGGVVRSVVASFAPPPPPIDLMILWVTWGATPLTPATFFSGAQAVCMAMDRS
jgi:hypothetical protein